MHHSSDGARARYRPESYVPAVRRHCVAQPAPGTQPGRPLPPGSPAKGTRPASCGATASLRGSAGFAAFATAKHGLRALAQSMARELGPLNVHVAHVVIDGAIDTAFIRDNFPERYAAKDHDGILSPGHVADAYWYLHTQPRDAWTFELDLRPWSERW